MLDLLHQVQAEYPDSTQGQFWAPARLGGTAPTPEQVQLEYEAYKSSHPSEKTEE